MSGVGLGLVIESLVTVLLAITVGYCVMLDKRLRRFRADEGGIRQTVVDLAMATERAENAIAGLRNTLAEADGSLSQRLRAAESFSAELDQQLKSGGQVLSRITQIVATSRMAASQQEAADAAVSSVEEVEELPLQETRANRLAEMLATARAMAERARHRQIAASSVHPEQSAA